MLQCAKAPQILVTTTLSTVPFGALVCLQVSQLFNEKAYLSQVRSDSKHTSLVT